ncbi:MAG: hypothetical protein LBT31_00390 [Synergistaceae bacterium]|nr:hypothetical protein [Synergistaceae bacterium]
MGVLLSVLNEDFGQILADPETIAALATTGSDGSVHVAFKGSFCLREDGNLEYDEVIEASQTNKNLVYSIWFGKTVSISFLAKDHRSFLVIGRPVRALVSGREFREHYVAIRGRLGDVDLSTVWIIEPVSVCEQSFEKRRTEEENAHPLFRHLDRLAVSGSGL